MTRMEHAYARSFAEHWQSSWNAHDLDALLAHFSPDVVFSSPVAAQLLPDCDGVIRGRDALRDYWTRALSMLPDLHFEVEAVYAGVDTIAISYRNHMGNGVCEILTFSDGLVIEGQATYVTDSAAAASGLPS
jgi:ketosteroid isomerase-like protein